MAERFGPGHPFIRIVNAIPGDEVRKTLEQYVILAGSAKSLALTWKVSQQYLCDLRKGRRAFTDDILDLLGYQRVIVLKQYHRAVKP